MKSRSPVLGYNHNVRYGGRTWHVQTEDSGVQNPHIFTHLFADGTIIGSKKTNYDVESDVTVVQKMMQQQHKLMLRDLKSGVFDEKIEKIFGPIVREPAEAEAAQPEPVPQPEAREAQAPAPPPDVPIRTTHEDERQTIPNLAPLLPPPAALPPTAPRTAARPPARLTPAPRAAVVAARSTSTAPPPTIGGRASPPPPPRSAAPTIGSGRAGVPQQNRPSVEGGVVARPTVIVGNGQKKGEAADFWKTTERKPEPGFGENLISERSLDEVILAYLSEDAPKK